MKSFVEILPKAGPSAFLMNLALAESSGFL